MEIEALSANQRYKKSKSSMPFKKWLKQEQMSGKMEMHEEMFNANGEMEAQVIPEKKGVNTSNILGVVAVGMLAYGIYQVGKHSE